MLKLSYEADKWRNHPEGYAVNVFARLRDRDDGDVIESTKLATAYGASHLEAEHRAALIVAAFRGASGERRSVPPEFTAGPNAACVQS